jgi:hypothetical protein
MDGLGLRGGQEPVGQPGEQPGSPVQPAPGDPQPGEVDLGHRVAGGDHEGAPAGRVDRQPGLGPLTARPNAAPVGRLLEAGGDPREAHRADPAVGVDDPQPRRADAVGRAEQQHQPVGQAAAGQQLAGQLGQPRVPGGWRVTAARRRR